MSHRESLRRRLVAGVAAATTAAGALIVSVAAPTVAHADVLSRGGDFVQTATATLADTRTGTGLPKAKIKGGTAADLTVTLPGVTMSNVSAVLLTVTVITPSAAGNLSVFPSGATNKGTSSVNFAEGQTISNTVAVAVPTSGRKVSFLLNTGTADLLVNAQGYYTAATGSTGPGGFVSVTHKRVLDTRSGLGAPKAKVANGGTLVLDLSASLPASTPNAYLDIIVVGATGNGHLRIAAGTSDSVAASRVNFVAGTTAQGLNVPLASDKVAISVSSASSVDLVATLEGYTANTSTAGGGFRPLQTRLASAVSLGAGAAVDVQVGGRNGLPLNGIAGVALNLTVRSSTAGGTLGVYPTGATDPGLSVDNYPGSSAARASFAVVGVGTDGKVHLVNRGSAAITLYVDQYGWFDAQTAVAPNRTYTATAAIQLAQQSGTTAPPPIVYSWVDNIGLLHVTYQTDPNNFTDLQSYTAPSDIAVRGPASLAPSGTGYQVAAQAYDTDVFVKNGTGDPAGWQNTPFTDLGGSMASAPALIAINGALTAFAVSPAGALWVYDESASAPAWRRLSSSPVLTGTPAVLATSGGVRLAVTGIDGTVSTAFYGNGVLGAWTALGGSGVTDRPTLISEPNSYARIVVRQGSYVLTKMQTSTTGFEPTWTTVTGPAAGAAGAPTGVLDPTTGRNALFVRDAVPAGSDAQLWVSYETSQGSGVFAGWAPLDGTSGVGTDPTALIYRNNSRTNYLLAWRTEMANSLQLTAVS